ncbi:MAG: BMC domain-containing protein [Deltaproteobacteria bacterium]|nr:BMC domain-containing protein [Deltaproteobacteria bacterium]MBW2069781.1 BMC domain-containing protein [Deltaproteobacteria bacterium]
MEKQSLGLIETWGMVAAIEAADAGSKAANVAFLGFEQVPTGLVVLRFVGDVAAVKAAVAAAEAAAVKVGRVVAVHVIPRPDEQIPRFEPQKPPPVEKQKTEAPPEGPPPSPAKEKAEKTLKRTARKRGKGKAESAKAVKKKGRKSRK